MNYNYSVLMAVYNGDKSDFLKIAIDSMLNQTIPPEQYVIVVDGRISKDLEDVLSDYEKNSIFTIVYLKENSGLANALNVGLTYCRNELVARMDADDISLSTRCEEELRLFGQYNDLTVCGCNIDEFYDDLDDIHTTRRVPSDYDDIRRFARIRQPFNHPTVMYKKETIINLGGYPDTKRKEDFDLFSRVILSGKYVRNIDSSLYLYRANKNNYVRRKSKENLKAAFKVYKLHQKRGGCNMFEYIIMCSGEIVFYLLPLSMMKYISDVLLRRKYNGKRDSTLF